MCGGDETVDKGGSGSSEEPTSAKEKAQHRVCSDAGTESPARRGRRLVCASGAFNLHLSLSTPFPWGFLSHTFFILI